MFWGAGGGALAFPPAGRLQSWVSDMVWALQPHGKQLHLGDGSATSSGGPGWEQLHLGDGSATSSGGTGWDCRLSPDPSVNITELN